ncbi:MAG: NUDIX domain-containing protein [Sphingomonas sp.]|uniref:NUDIX hydrolase n=1 Tax=Sphingomonas sp. TaxID=28214 RepID=UPI0017A77E12|nr:NUDIX domain-containing protein [Sphingomonas sp.]MBA3668029.1 NUDIX domain-containing protein [Sphingomonas sp.]
MDEPAIPAATLVVWRDPPATSAEAPSILVVERSARMAFAAGAIVFPGGRVDEADRQLAAEIGAPGDAAKITAIRETIEESGVIAGMTGSTEPSLGLILQQSLIAGAPFGDLLATHKLTIDLAALTPFARWIPAFKQPRKFDTIFFIIRAPEGDWPPHPQPGECVAAEWVSPAALLDRIAAGTASAIFPTKRNVERLAQHASFAAALADARAHSIDTIVPWVAELDGERRICIPEGRGYPVTSEPLSSAIRA